MVWEWQSKQWSGEKEILGFYIGDSESAKYWTNILNEIKNRGVKDILILCADGLKGLKEAIGTVYPMKEFQRCIVHMIRNTLQYVSYKDRKELAKDLKRIYQAPTEENYNKLCEKGINAILYTEDNRYGWIDCRNHELKHKTQEACEQQAKGCAFFQGKKYVINRGRQG